MDKKAIFDKMLDDILYETAPIAENELMENNSDNINDNIVFSKEHETKMKKIFNIYKRQSIFKKLITVSKRIAIFVLILSVIGTVCIFSIEALRIHVFNFIIDVKDNHSSIKFKEEDIIVNSYKAEDISIEYLPEGFNIKQNQAVDDGLFLLFANDSNLYLSIRISKVDGAYAIDTEGATIKEVFINDKKAVLSEKTNIKILVWNIDTYSITLSGNLETSELLRIAEKIKK